MQGWTRWLRPFTRAEGSSPQPDVLADVVALRHAIDMAPSAMLIADPHGIILAANRHLEAMFGYGAGELVGHSIEVLMPARYRQRHVGLRQYFMARGESRAMGNGEELFGRRKDDTEFALTIGLSIHEGRQERRIIASAFDASEHSRSRRAAAEATALAKSIFAAAPFSMIATDAQGTILSANPAAEHMLWYGPGELVGATPEILHDRSEMEARANELSHELGEPVAPSFEVFVTKARRGQDDVHEWTYRRKDGSSFPVRLHTCALRTGCGPITGYLGIGYDISEQRRANEYIRQVAYRDALTSLPNRALLQDRLEVALRRAQELGGSVGLLMIDLDFFKRINDSLGHHVGDQLLMQAAQRLQEAVRPIDTIARMGGDEFVVLLPDLPDEDITRIAQDIADRMTVPFTVGTHDLQVTASVGIALYPNHGQDAAALLMCADTAMYDAKRSGRNRIQVFTPHMAFVAAEQMRLEAALRRAVGSNQFELHYQPQVCLRQRTVVGIEALLRWRHPELGLVPPSTFIPVAEQTGLIVPVGEWVLRNACRDFRRLRAQTGRDLTLSVNLSPRQMQQKTLVQMVEEALADQQVPADRLDLEITESSLMQASEEVMQRWSRLRALGVRLSIDDFGTGFSSLSYLTTYAVDRIKIDRSFVVDLSQDPSKAAVVAAIIVMCRALGVEPLAEGVESETQLRALHDLGCETFQGFLFSRPVQAHDMPARLDEISARFANRFEDAV